MTIRRTVLLGALAVAAGGATLAGSAADADAQPLTSSRLSQPSVSSNFRSSYVLPGGGLTNPGVRAGDPYVKEDTKGIWINSPRPPSAGQLTTNPALGANVQQSFQRNLRGR